MKAYLTALNIAGLVVLLLGVAAFLLVGRQPHSDFVNIDTVKVTPEEQRQVELRLYFAKPDASGFIVEKREVALEPGQSVYQRALNELVLGPQKSGEPLLPANTPAPTVFVSGKTAYVNLPKEYSRLGYGTTGETLLIYGIANTILDQGKLDEVWFLIGGQPAKTLGHISLEEPIRRRR